MNLISLENRSFEYEVNRKTINSLRLKMISPTSFQISCPRLTPEFIIKKFIKNNSQWIINHSLKIIPKKDVLSLNNIEIIGKIYEIYWTKTQRDSVIINEYEQKIYSNLTILNETHAKKILEVKLRPFALKLIKKELEILSTNFNFKYHHVTVRNQSSRYGSCSGYGNLNFNWQIIFFPYSQFRHVLLHELTHLDIKNHSKKFWDQLTIYDSDCQKNNLWLKKEGLKYLIFN